MLNWFEFLVANWLAALGLCLVIALAASYCWWRQRSRLPGADRELAQSIESVTSWKPEDNE